MIHPSFSADGTMLRFSSARTGPGPVAQTEVDPKALVMVHIWGFHKWGYLFFSWLVMAIPIESGCGVPLLQESSIDVRESFPFPFFGRPSGRWAWRQRPQAPWPGNHLRALVGSSKREPWGKEKAYVYDYTYMRAYMHACMHTWHAHRYIDT